MGVEITGGPRSIIFGLRRAVLEIYRFLYFGGKFEFLAGIQIFKYVPNQVYLSAKSQIFEGQALIGLIFSGPCPIKIASQAL